MIFLSRFREPRKNAIEIGSIIVDPNTHLELTMIHEVMVLDHGGPDFAFILYAAALKLWVLGSLLTGFVVPAGPGATIDFADRIDAQGFTIDNPNAQGSCACGDSFH